MLAAERTLTDGSPTPARYRWVVLTVFLLVAGLSQAVWLNFAPLLTLVQQRYAVSEDAAGLLILVFPALYVLLSLPSGLLIDRRGYRASLRLAAAGMAVFSLMRVLDHGFVWLLAAQTGLAVFQPFAVNAISKLVQDWFPADQRALATGLGTMGLFLGMAVGIAATPAMVDAWGYQSTMAAWAGIAVALCIACFALVRERPGGAAPTPTAQSSLRPLFAERPLLLLFAVAGLGLGYFNGLTTWLEPILAQRGLNAVQAGAAGGLLIVGGIVGSVAIPALSDLLRRRKPLVLASVLAAGLTLWPAVHSNVYSTVLIASALQGFCFLPAFALLLEMCSELAGEARAGAATSVLMLAGNAGGVLVIVAMALLKDGASWDPAVLLLFGLLAAAGLGTWLLPETHHRRATDHASG
jgi:predicted MFS family arabinose efflux permease